MRFLIPLLFSGLFFFQNGYGQDTAVHINKAWATLKAQLQRRTDIVSNLVSIMSKSTKVNKEQLSNSKLFAVDLFNYIDTLSLKDSLSISRASEMNSKLTQALARTLASVENDKAFRSNNQFLELLMQLEGSENRIVVARRDYNDICKEYKRKDLLFKSDRFDEAPKIEF